jgi:transglutaminase-like putative cysteine protease
MKYLIITLLLLLNIHVSQARNDDDTFFAASLIAPEFKENAHAVIRNANVDLSILSTSKIKYKKSMAVTILDAKGADYAKLYVQYNLLKKIDDISGNIYDASGKVIKEIRKKDALDMSTYGSGIFHSDSRVLKFNFDHYKYPFTVEYTIEATLNTTFFLPDWDVQPSKDCAVQYSSYTVTYPPEIPVRFKEYLMPSSLLKSDTKDKNGNIVLSWNLRKIPARYEQPFSKADNYESPTLLLCADKFNLLDHEGDMNSWKDLGAFIYKLNEGLDVLPEDKKAMVKSLTDGEASTYGKVQKLYKYMQETTRYVAIEYGINGWQTFDAMDVAKNGYGDCKGLTNYLKALLKEAGIKSYATSVYAGGQDYYKLDESFPSNVFNHIILCVPDKKDTIWVECTSSQLEAGYLGDFTEDRKVLLITENGGFICKTPSYDFNKSFISRKATLTLNPDESIQKVNINNHYSGPMQDELAYYAKTETENKLKEMVNSKFPFATYSVDNFKYTQVGDYHTPALNELVNVSVSGITTKTQKRTFLNLGWMNNPMTSITQSDKRTAPLVLSESFKITDSVIVNIPEGLAIESMPESINLSYDFGSYNTKFEKGSNQIVFIRSYIQNKGAFKVEDYDSYVKMYSAINAGKNNLNLVFLNNKP